MVNKSKLNKKIVTGVAAVALFAPLALHSAQANAAEQGNNTPNTARTANPNGQNNQSSQNSGQSSDANKGGQSSNQGNNSSNDQSNSQPSNNNPQNGQSDNDQNKDKPSDGGSKTPDKPQVSEHDTQVADTLNSSDTNSNVASVTLNGNKPATLGRIQGSDVANIQSITLNQNNSGNSKMVNADQIKGDINSFKSDIKAAPAAPVHHNGSDLKTTLQNDGVQKVSFNDDKGSIDTDNIDTGVDYAIKDINNITLNNVSTSVSNISDVSGLNDFIRQVKSNNNLKSTLSGEGIQAVHFNDDNGDVNTNDIKSDGNYTLKDISNVTFNNTNKPTYVDTSSVNNVSDLKGAIDNDKSPASAPTYHNGNDLKSTLSGEGIQAVHFNDNNGDVKANDIKDDGDYTLKDIDNVTFNNAKDSTHVDMFNVNNVTDLKDTIEQAKSRNKDNSSNQSSKDQESVKNSIDDFQNRISNDKSQIKGIQKRLDAKQDHLTDDQQQLTEFSSDQYDDESGQSNVDQGAVQNSIDDFQNRINDDKGQVEDVQNQLSAKQDQLNHDQQQLAEFGHSTGQNVDINGKAQPSNSDNSKNGNNNGNNNSNNNTNNNNVTPSNSGIVNIPTNNSNANNTNANNNANSTTPKTNDNSAQISFPDAPSVAPQHKAKHHKASTRKSKKVSAKQMKSDRASVKKNQKHLKAVKKALRKAKGKARKAKLNKQLRKAKKAFAKSEKKLNHAIHNAK